MLPVIGFGILIFLVKSYYEHKKVMADAERYKRFHVKGIN